MSSASLNFQKDDMSSFQMTMVGMCLVINMIDGFDVLAIAFTGPSIAAEWGIGPAELGILFSSGLLGMALGSLFIGPFADKWGRRPLVLGCLVIITTGMFLSAMATDMWQLSAFRLYTGLGIGGMLASINTLVSEFASDKRREFCVSVLQSGYPTGATIGGVVSVYLLAQYDWRAVFIFGGTASAIMLVITWFTLSESIDYLSTQKKPETLGRINSILTKMGRKTLTTLPNDITETKEATSQKSFDFKTLFSKEYLHSTLTIWLGFFCIMFTFYFAINWTPKIIADFGNTIGEGVSFGVWFNGGGILGALSLGFIAGHFDVRKLVSIFMVLSFITLAAFGFLPNHFGLMMGIGLAIGFLLNGSMIGLYAIVPQIYKPGIRTFGTGWAIGIGRLGAVLGPYVAGLIIAAGYGRDIYYPLLAAPVLIAAFTILRIKINR
jgi:benzoate transport